VTVAARLDYKVPDLEALAKPDDTQSEPRAPTRTQPLGNQAALADAKDSDLQMPLDLGPPPVAAWVEAWNDAKVNVAILAVLLSVLTLIFVFQARPGAPSPRPPGWCATAFCSLSWSGSAGPPACSSRSSNVMNYAMAPFNHFDIGFYRRRAADGHRRRPTRWSRWC